MSVAVGDGRGRLCLDPDDGCRTTAFRPDGSLAPPLYYAVERLRAFINLRFNVELVPASARAICGTSGQQNAHLDRIGGNDTWALLSDIALLTPVSQCTSTTNQMFWLVWRPEDSRRSGGSALKSQPLFLSRWR